MSAGPPLVTDDPGVAGAGNAELIFALTHQERRAEETLDLPLVDVTVGLRDDLDFLLSTSRSETDFASNDSEEALPASVGAKWLAASGERWLLGTAPALRRDLRDGRSLALYLPLLGEVRHGPWSIGAEAGYAFTDRRPDAWNAGIYAARALRGDHLLLIEAWGADSEDDVSEAGWSLGAEVRLADEYRLLVSAGRTLHASGTPRLRYQVFLGLQRLIGSASQ